MSDKNGYVVIEAEPVQFNAVIKTKYLKGLYYRVEVKFGNKLLIFDPYNGKKESIRSFTAAREILEKRVDLKNVTQVVEDFEKAANRIVSLMKADQLLGYRRKE